MALVAGAMLHQPHTRLFLPPEAMDRSQGLEKVAEDMKEVVNEGRGGGGGEVGETCNNPELAVLDCGQILRLLETIQQERIDGYLLCKCNDHADAH